MKNAPRRRQKIEDDPKRKRETRRVLELGIVAVNEEAEIRNTSVGGSEASESYKYGGDVSDFLDPDDADEASALFDEPQFEPMYAPEFKHDPFMADDELDSFSYVASGR